MAATSTRLDLDEEVSRLIDEAEFVTQPYRSFARKGFGDDIELIEQVAQLIDVPDDFSAIAGNSSLSLLIADLPLLPL